MTRSRPVATTRLPAVLAAIPLLASLAGCVAPEEAPVVRRPVQPAAATSLPANLEPAPLANRRMTVPEGPSVLQVDGLSKPKSSGRLPPL